MDEDQPNRSSLMRARIGNREYDLRKYPRCRVCIGRYRREIETMLVEGRSYLSIYQEIKDLEAQRSGTTEGIPSVQGITNHYKNGHMPLALSVQRRIIEERARELGKSLEESETLIDYVTVSRAVVQKGFERLQHGELEPEIKDILAASRLLSDIDKSQGEAITDQAWREAMLIYLETARELMPSEMWQEFGRRLSNNPILKALEGQAASETDTTITVEAVDLEG